MGFSGESPYDVTCFREAADSLGISTLIDEGNSGSPVVFTAFPNPKKSNRFIVERPVHKVHFLRPNVMKSPAYILISLRILDTVEETPWRTCQVLRFVSICLLW